MPDSPVPDPVAAYLAEAKERAEQITPACEPDCGGEPCTGHDALRLLAAVERVLALHRSDSGESTYNKQCGQDGFGWPCPTYRAISAALLGKED